MARPLVQIRDVLLIVRAGISDFDAGRPPADKNGQKPVEAQALDGKTQYEQKLSRWKSAAVKGT